MLNPKIQKNKTSNQNIAYKHKILYCKICNKETYHRIWNSGSTSCCKCDFKDNGLKLKYCKTCNKETIHNGNVCCQCNPQSNVAKNLHIEYCNKCGKNTLHFGIKCHICYNIPISKGFEFKYCKNARKIQDIWAADVLIVTLGKYPLIILNLTTNVHYTQMKI